MNAQEMKTAYNDLYGIMAQSNKQENMELFGKVMTEMFYWMADNQPQAAKDWLEKLSAIKWNNYLTPAEAEKIVSEMKPQAPWDRNQWKAAMEQHGLAMDDEPYYNSCALWVTMNMEMSDSQNTYKKYIDEANLFNAVHDLAVDRLKDKDNKFLIREYFHV